MRHAGYVYDQESGLYYLSARYYDPSTASFLTKDPADADGEESPYQYCGGNPVGKVDPSGEAYMTFNGYRLRIYRFVGRWGGKNRYSLKIDIRAITGDMSISWKHKYGPIPPGTWYLLFRRWRFNRENNKGYGPSWGLYNGPLIPGKNTYSRSAGGHFYLHSYDPKRWSFRHTHGCIRIDPWNVNSVFRETYIDNNGRVPIYVSYR